MSEEIAVIHGKDTDANHTWLDSNHKETRANFLMVSRCNERTIAHGISREAFDDEDGEVGEWLCKNR